MISVANKKRLYNKFCSFYLVVNMILVIIVFSLWIKQDNVIVNIGI
jgi:hypothetical protein